MTSSAARFSFSSFWKNKFFIRDDQLWPARLFLFIIFGKSSSLLAMISFSGTFFLFIVLKKQFFVGNDELRCPFFFLLVLKYGVPCWQLPVPPLVFLSLHPEIQVLYWQWSVQPPVFLSLHPGIPVLYWQLPVQPHAFLSLRFEKRSPYCADELVWFFLFCHLLAGIISLIHYYSRSLLSDSFFFILHLPEMRRGVSPVIFLNWFDRVSNAAVIPFSMRSR